MSQEQPLKEGKPELQISFWIRFWLSLPWSGLEGAIGQLCGDSPNGRDFLNTSQDLPCPAVGGDRVASGKRLNRAEQMECGPEMTPLIQHLLPLLFEAMLPARCQVTHLLVIPLDLPGRVQRTHDMPQSLHTMPSLF